MATTLGRLDSPRSLRAIERTYAGFQRSLQRMSPEELLDLSTRQAAALQEQASRLISETLLDYHRQTIDQVVLSTTPPLPGPSAREPDDRPSPRSRPPAPPAARSTSPQVGRRLARELTRAAQAVNAKRARAEGRR